MWVHCIHATLVVLMPTLRLLAWQRIAGTGPWTHPELTVTLAPFTLSLWTVNADIQILKRFRIQFSPRLRFVD